MNFNTRYREGQQPSLLDLIIVNDDQMVDNVKEASLFGKSDHVVIEFDLRCYANNDNEKSER